MSHPETVTVDATECYLFPIPLDTKDDPVADAEFFLNCAYARLFNLNQSDTHRSRQLSLAITNIEQGALWFDAYRRRRESGIPPDRG